MSLLSTQQKKDLDKSIFDYLIGSGYMESAALLQKEAKIEHIEDGNQNKQNDLLQRKWLSVVRLQKKIMKLEKELETFRSTNKTNNQQVSDGLPIAPCKVTLKGHRDNVNSVKFHPEYDTVLCSASEDATIRTWDTESGTVEKSIKRAYPSCKRY